MLQWCILGVSILAYLDAKEHREWERRSLDGVYPITNKDVNYG